jgi:hypothetical protein
MRAVVVGVGLNLLVVGACSGGGAGGGAGAGGAGHPTGGAGGVISAAHASNANGVVSVVVLDGSEAPVAGAAVHFGTITSRNTDAAGRATATLQTGHVVMTIQADGFLHWAGQVPVTTANPELTLHLKARAANQTIDAAGGTISDGPASVTFPPDAFGVAQQVAVTYVDSAHLGALGRAHNWNVAAAFDTALSAIVVSAVGNPAQPYTLTYPLPPGAASPTIRSINGSGQRGAPIMPKAMTATAATFTVTATGEYELELGFGAEDHAIAESTFMATDTRAGTTALYHAGDALPHEMALDATAAPATYTGPDGVRVTLTGGKVSVYNLAPGEGTLTCDGSCAGLVEDYDAPNSYSVVPRTGGSKVKVGTKSLVRFTVHDCPDGHGPVFALEVAEGKASVGATTISPNFTLRECAGCTDKYLATCCDAASCATGCCAADQTCMSGTTPNACGSAGGKCSACDATCSAAQMCGG